MVEADAVVRSLSIAMHAEQAMVLPLLQLKEFDQYTTTHSMNVSVLAMAMGEFLDVGPATVRALGVAGLLHDLGKACIPRDILVNRGLSLTRNGRLSRNPYSRRQNAAGEFGPDGARGGRGYEHHIAGRRGLPKLHDARGARMQQDRAYLRRVRCPPHYRPSHRHAWESERAMPTSMTAPEWSSIGHRPALSR